MLMLRENRDYPRSRWQGIELKQTCGAFSDAQETRWKVQAANSRPEINLQTTLEYSVAAVHCGWKQSEASDRGAEGLMCV